MPADSATGECWDTYFSAVLAPGNYTVSVMEYDNFAEGPNLTNGFTRQGQGNFTATKGWCALDDAPNATGFCDVSSVRGGARTNAWAFDILNVDSASMPTPPVGVPESSGLALMSGGLVLLLWLNRRQRCRA